MRARRRTLTAVTAVTAAVLSFVPVRPAAAGPPKVGNECRPCIGCDLVVGDKRVPYFRYSCPPQ